MSEQQDGDAKPVESEIPPQRVSGKAGRSPNARAKKEAPAASEDSRSTRRRRFTSQEKTRVLEEIDQKLQSGKNIKSVLASVGLKPQTYYLWRRSSKGQATSGKQEDLESLQKENIRLKRLLAERLMKENSELKRRLGM